MAASRARAEDVAMGRHPDLPAEFSSDLRSIFDNAVEGIYRVDSTGRVVMAN